MKRPVRLAWLVLFLLGGCELDRGPRRVPFPHLDPHQPFTSEGAAATPGAAAAAPVDPFAARLATPAVPAPAPAAAAFQSVALGGILAARLPQDFDAWRWTASGPVTLVLAAPRGRSTALIYAEAISTLADVSPSVEASRFHRTVAPLLVVPWLGRPPVPARFVAELADETDLSFFAVRQALDDLATRTLGRGLGFQAAVASFSGWKWIGRNPQGVEVRLGRLHGRWGPQEPPPAATLRVLDALVARGLLPASLRDRLDAAPPAGASEEGTPAFLVVGRATLRRGDGVHLAILCRQTPACAVEEALAGFLDSLEPGGSGAAAHTGSLAALAAEAGVTLEVRPPAIRDIAPPSPP